ncbi:hypothetical protein FNF29_00139 [Cafeteria roenbergensis]|uniref:Endonuclease/exonuclease/phosphatase domain-containing protein n=1 Tax=Cafeteria roenbergensis TaxID=33653 RepID=A0A5A8CWL4_CAFRO|nr:hypothetical protein FNF29_00139 [Cafeteria roenbergensis]|eukprot:KAA0157563.1 hypothetical protein FNF29_00139 [Cafeteria roenbergensis]
MGRNCAFGRGDGRERGPIPDQGSMAIARDGTLDSLGAVGGDAADGPGGGDSPMAPRTSPVGIGIGGGFGDIGDDEAPAQGLGAGMFAPMTPADGEDAERDREVGATIRGIMVEAMDDDGGADGDGDGDGDDETPAPAAGSVTPARRTGAASGAGGDAPTPRSRIMERASGRSAAGGRGSPERGKLSARLNEPVEGVHLVPFVALRTDDGRMLRADDGHLSFTWYRSSSLAPCAFPLCPNATDPTAESTIRAVGLEASRTGRGAFCSKECFCRAWPTIAAETSAGSAGPTVALGAKALLDAGASESSAAEAYKDLVSALCTPGTARAGAAAGAAGAVGGGGGWDELDGSERAFAMAELARSVPALPDSETESWTEVGTSLGYTPTADDVLRRLRVEVAADMASMGGANLLRVVDSQPVVAFPVAPPSRPWHHLAVDPYTKLRRPAGTAVATHGDRSKANAVRVVSFNVLAEIYGNRGVYPYCPAWALAFDYRKKLIAQELRALDADVVCLQEVQTDHYASFFLPEMHKLGYEGLYRQKNRQSMGVAGKVDGCAMFFKSSRFGLLEKYNLDFNEAVKKCCEGEAAKAKGMNAIESKSHLDRVEKIKRRLSHDNVAQVVVLEMHKSPSGAPLPEPVRLCVANTHLFWDPEYEDVKLWQTHKLLGELEKSMSGQHACPIILCGDFNSEPTSPVHQLLAGNARMGHRAVLPFDQLPEDRLAILSMQGSAPLCHSLFLSSAYGTVLGQEPEYTNFTKSYVGCLDYVWYTATNITPLAVLAIPKEEELLRAWGTHLPNPQHPSDHIALCTDLLVGTPSMAAPMTGAGPPTAQRSSSGFVGMPGQQPGRSGLMAAHHSGGLNPMPGMALRGGRSGAAASGGAGAMAARMGVHSFGVSASPQRLQGGREAQMAAMGRGDLSSLG